MTVYNVKNKGQKQPAAAKEIPARNLGHTVRPGTGTRV